MPVARYKAAGVIINGAARELGLPVATDPFASQDPNMRQLVQHLNTLGLGLLDAFAWEHLMRTHAFTTIAGVSQYDLPPDYHEPRDETQWNTTAKLPLIGPLTPQAWQTRQQLMGSTLSLEYRLTANQILLAQGTQIQGGETVSFEYKSRAWVRSATSGIGNGNTLGPDGSDEVVAFGDYPLFDPLVLHYGLKLLWRAAKQFNVQYCLADFTRALDKAKGRAHGSKSLPVSPPQGRGSETM